MRIRQTIVDIAGLGEPSELDELSGAVCFAARTAVPSAIAVVGPRVDGYVLVERVATTPCAEVFTARHPERPTLVVVGLLRDAGNAASTRATVRSLAVLARLQHPNIAAVLDAGMHWGRPFGVFAPLAGTSLGAWLRAPHTAGAVLAVYRDVATGLAACHRAGVGGAAFASTSVIVGTDGRARIVLPNLRSCEAVDEVDGCQDFGLAIAHALSRREGATAPRATLARLAPRTMVEWTDALGAALRGAKG